MDYGKWIDRLERSFAAPRRFLAGEPDLVRAVIGPPLGNSDLDDLAAALDCGLPPPLRGLLAVASSLTFVHESDGFELESFWPSFWTQLDSNAPGSITWWTDFGPRSRAKSRE